MTPLSILLVEDDPSSNAILGNLLQKHGQSVTRALTAQEALRAAKAKLFDLAILDLKLPDDNGWNLYVKLKGMAPGLRGIALSGYGQNADFNRSKIVGFAAHLTKPLEFSGLESAMLRAFPSTQVEELGKADTRVDRKNFGLQ